MKTGSVLLLLLLATAIAFTSGCSTTLVESLPIGKVTRCDAAWPGRWKAMQQNQGRNYQDAWLQINADCTQLTFTDPEKTETEAHLLTLISTRTGDFLSFSTPGDKPACFGEGNTHCGTELMRYVHAGSQISLYRADHAKVHDALESHIVSGYTEMRVDPSTPTATNGTQTGQPAVPTTILQARAMAEEDGAKQQPTFHNLIAGGPEQITTILAKHPEFFEASPWMILQRDDLPAQGRSP